MRFRSFAILQLLAGVVVTDLCDHEQVLLDKIFEKYNTRIRPAKDDAATV